MFRRVCSLTLAKSATGRFPAKVANRDLMTCVFQPAGDAVLTKVPNFAPRRVASTRKSMKKKLTEKPAPLPFISESLSNTTATLGATATLLLETPKIVQSPTIVPVESVIAEPEPKAATPQEKLMGEPLSVEYPTEVSAEEPFKKETANFFHWGATSTEAITTTTAAVTEEP